MHFELLTDQHLDICRPYFELLSYPTCDYTVGGVFMWRDLYDIEFAADEEALFIRYHEEGGDIYYGLPIFKDVSAGIAKLIAHEKEQGNNIIRFCAIPAEYTPCFEGLRVVNSYPQTEYFDYLYAAEDLINLSGKKFGGQRNLISQFGRLYPDGKFEVLNEGNLDEVREFFDSFSSADLNEDKNAENDLVHQVLEKEGLYGMFGGVLYAEGKVAGFSVGEIVGDTLYVHIEKADRNVKGAYQTLNNRFAAHFGKGVQFINREDDTGDLGLRKAKLAYHPIRLLEKFVFEIEI